MLNKLDSNKANTVQVRYCVRELSEIANFHTFHKLTMKKLEREREREKKKKKFVGKTKTEETEGYADISSILLASILDSSLMTS